MEPSLALMSHAIFMNNPSTIVKNICIKVGVSGIKNFMDFSTTKKEKNGVRAWVQLSERTFGLEGSGEKKKHNWFTAGMGEPLLTPNPGSVPAFWFASKTMRSKFITAHVGTLN